MVELSLLAAAAVLLAPALWAVMVWLASLGLGAGVVLAPWLLLGALL